MGKRSPSPPPAPDPVATANAQGAMNKETAAWNAALGRTNQVTPYGTLTYTSNNNATADLPATYTATTSLSPDEQRKLDLANQFEINTGKLGNEQLGRIASALSSDFNYSGIPEIPGEADLNTARDKIADALYGQSTSRLDPQWQQEKNSFDATMFARGIQPGSEAYKIAFDDFSRAKNDAYAGARNNAIAGGGSEQNRLFGLGLARRQQGIQEYTTKRNTPLNEASALLSGTQVQNPSFINAPTSSAAAPDYQGAVYNNYQGQLNAYGQKMQNNASAMGGMFGLLGTGAQLALPAMFPQTFGAGAILSAMASDIRLKENIEPAGYENGVPIYTFNYKDDPEKIKCRGVMAQDILESHPHAVEIGDNGFYQVYYSQIGVNFVRGVH